MDHRGYTVSRMAGNLSVLRLLMPQRLSSWWRRGIGEFRTSAWPREYRRGTYVG